MAAPWARPYPPQDWALVSELGCRRGVGWGPCRNALNWTSHCPSAFRHTSISGLLLRESPQLWPLWLIPTGPPTVSPTTGTWLHLVCCRATPAAVHAWPSPAWAGLWSTSSEPAQPCLLTTSTSSTFRVSAKWDPWPPTVGSCPAARLPAAAERFLWASSGPSAQLWGSLPGHLYGWQSAWACTAAASQAPGP